MSLPAFVTSEQLIAGQIRKADSQLPWREAGISEHDLHSMWAAGLVYFKLPQVDAAPRKKR